MAGWAKIYPVPIWPFWGISGFKFFKPDEFAAVTAMFPLLPCGIDYATHLEVLFCGVTPARARPYKAERDGRRMLVRVNEMVSDPDCSLVVVAG